MPVLLDVEESLKRVRSGMLARADRLSGRVGESLAAYVGRPGKMLRARFCVLLGAALGVAEEKTEAAARALEFVHNASLLHDDCVDSSELRRGRPSPNALFGNKTALIIGDLAFSQGLEESIDVSPRAPEHLVSTVREMAIGELQEEFLKGSSDVTLEAYLGIAGRKTGALFEWCGKILSELGPFPHEAADPPRLASSAGILLQIVDDIHDFVLSREVSGKPATQDAANRKLNLPCILALEDAAARDEFLRLWAEAAASPAGLQKAVDFIVKKGFLDSARRKADEIVSAMRVLCRALPLRAEADQLDRFIEAMARRGF